MNGRLELILNPKDSSIFINEDVLLALGRPEQIQIMINEEKQMLLVKACTIEDREALVVPITKAADYEVSGRSLIRRVRKLTDWTDDEPKKVRGVMVPNFTAVVFALSTLEAM